MQCNFRVVYYTGREFEPLEIELLRELLDTIVYADRVVSYPARSLLLVGRSGVGRHTAVKLLSVLQTTRVFCPYPGRNYGRKQLINDLKLVCLLKDVC